MNLTSIAVDCGATPSEVKHKVVWAMKRPASEMRVNQDTKRSAPDRSDGNSCQHQAVEMMRLVKQANGVAESLVVAEELLTKRCILFPQREDFLFRWVVDLLIQSVKHKDKRHIRSSAAYSTDCWVFLTTVAGMAKRVSVHSDLGFAISIAIDACTFSGPNTAPHANLAVAVQSAVVCLGRDFRPRVESLSVIFASLHAARSRIAALSIVYSCVQ